MRIVHNIAALNAQRQMGVNASNVGNSLEKLSSGLRINRASDDAAGLAISEKMRGQIRGLEQAGRNIQDAISLVQTAEGGLNEIHALLQRGRELSVQAGNDTQTSSDRQAIQDEVNQIIEEIDNISNSTEFNNKKLLNRAVEVDMDELQKFQDALPGMLNHAENLVENAFGLKANNAPMDIEFKNIDNVGGVLALVRSGGGSNTKMEIDVSDLGEYIAPHGNDDEINYFDATIAHEMVHAVFAETINSVPTWFNEGSAEYLSGGADRLYARVHNSVVLGSAATEDDAIQQVIDAIGDGSSWGGQSLHYASAYGAVSYLDKQFTTDIKAFFNDLKTNNFETALKNNTNYNTTKEFLDDYKSNGLSHVKVLYEGYKTSKNVGAATGGYNPNSVPAYGPMADPLEGWVENFLDLDSDSLDSGPLTFQIGANGGQQLDLDLGSVNSSALSIGDVDMIAGSQLAISSFDNAIQKVSGFRSRLGAVQNRLEHSYNVTENSAQNLTASESRIRDTDMAREMMNFTKNNILNQAAQAMLAQAQQLPQGVLQLLR